MPSGITRFQGYGLTSGRATVGKQIERINGILDRGEDRHRSQAVENRTKQEGPKEPSIGSQTKRINKIDGLREGSDQSRQSTE